MLCIVRLIIVGILIAGVSPIIAAPDWVPPDKKEAFDGLVRECQTQKKAALECAKIRKSARKYIDCEVSGKSVVVETDRGGLIEEEVREYDIEVEECRIENGKLRVFFKEPPPKQGFFARVWDKTKEYAPIIILSFVAGGLLI